MWSGPEAVKKDTVRNIQETGEFVIQVVSKSLSDQMNKTSCEVAFEVDEFELAGLSKAKSLKVKPPRVAEAKAYLECKLSQIVTVGEGSGAGCAIFGEVLAIEVDDDIVSEGDRISLDALDPIGRLSGSDYCGVGDRFSLERPSPEELSRPGRR